MLRLATALLAVLWALPLTAQPVAREAEACTALQTRAASGLENAFAGLVTDPADPPGIHRDALQRSLQTRREVAAEAVRCVEYARGNACRIVAPAEAGNVTARTVAVRTASDEQLLEVLWFTWGADAWHISDRNTYTYDAAGNLTRSVWQSWNATTQAWENSSSYAIRYDAEGRDTEWATYTWNAQRGAWDGVRRNEYTYNAAGDLTGYAGYTWSQADADWVGEFRYQDTLDDQGRWIESVNYVWDALPRVWVHESRAQATYAGDHLAEYVASEWDLATQAWKTTRRSTFAYDGSGNVQEDVFYVWSAGAWLPNTRTTYAYDAAGLKTGSQTFGYMSGTWRLSSRSVVARSGRLTTETWQWLNAGQWQLTSKSEQAVDDAGYDVFYASYSYDVATQRWKGDYKREYAYDEQGYRTLVATYRDWDGAAQTWIGDYKYEYAYDTRGNRTVFAHFRGWDASAGDFVGVVRFEYSYDSASLYTGSLSYAWQAASRTWVPDGRDAYQIENGRTVSSLHEWWDAPAQRWENKWRSEYRYGTQTDVSAPDAPDAPAITLWPNPASEAVSMRLHVPGGVQAHVTFFDALGREVKNLHAGQLAPGEQVLSVPVAALAPGLYHVRVQWEGHAEARSFVVAR